MPREVYIPPFGLLLALLIAVPLVELYLLIQVGGRIGALPTVGLVILTAVIGASLLRIQGLSTIARVRASLDHGKVPAIELIEGLILLVTGALLLTPGFFTDALGFACLIPRVRRRIATGFLEKFLARSNATSGRRDSRTIEGDFWRDD